MEYRPLGNTGIQVSAVALGCWPIAGMTSPGANDKDSLATIRACFELGINHLDTAYMYGQSGQSERLIARALGSQRREMVIATKGGLHCGADGKQGRDASPRTLRRQCEESLKRLATDYVDLLYLHAPDKNVPLAESAAALKGLMDEGKTRAVGVSNLNMTQLEEFSAECPIAAYQPPYNMLQREIERDTLPWCRRHTVSVLVYWPLLKGLLTGKFARDHVFAESDSRRKYAEFHGDQWHKNLDLLDRLRAIANGLGRTVTELVINWTIHQPGITAALCGAKRAEQISQSAAGAEWRLSDQTLAQIEQALGERDAAV